MIFADLESVEKRILRFTKAARSGDAAAKTHLRVTQKVKEFLEEGKLVRAGDWTEEERESIKDAQLITSKPFLFVCNVDEDSVADGNELVNTVIEHAENMDSKYVIICAQAEAELSELEPDERVEFLNDLGIEEPGLAKLARATYDLLGMQTYFTAGEKEIRAWTIMKGWKAPKAAGVIHSDFERGFIRAEVYQIDDLQNLKSKPALKAAGKLRIEGKDYTVKDGDVMLFRFNV